ncbi:MAG: hypothetical protein IT317_19770 [Anaerolineales bacterium]|nr:hypothetical protein [Anaerolineales bacterium]
MPKTFYTERDVADLADRGVTTIEISDDVVVTDLGRDMAHNRGVKLVRAKAPAPADDEQAALIHRVKAAVLARLGEQVDAAVLDAAVNKVVGDAKEQRR